MAEINSNDKQDNLMLVLGAVGIFALLMGAMGYAIWESGAHYETQQINQFVVEQSAADLP